MLGRSYLTQLQKQQKLNFISLIILTQTPPDNHPRTKDNREKVKLLNVLYTIPVQSIPVLSFKNLKDSLRVQNYFLFLGNRVVIPVKFRNHVMGLLDLGLPWDLGQWHDKSETVG